MNSDDRPNKPSQSHPGDVAPPDDPTADPTADLTALRDDGAASRSDDANSSGNESGSEMADLVAPVWSERRTRQALGDVSEEALAILCTHYAVLGLPASDDPSLRYPVFQFVRHDGVARVKPSLAAFMMTLTYRDPWSVAIILKTPAPELDGATPVDWERQGGDPDILTWYARVLNTEFGRPPPEEIANPEPGGGRGAQNGAQNPDLVPEVVTRAHADLQRLRLTRRIASALIAGDPHTDVGATHDVSEVDVARVARRLRAGYDPARHSVDEIIARRVVGEITEHQMMGDLLRMDLPAGRHDPTGGGGYRRGLWDDVQSAVGRGLLTKSQYDALVVHHHGRHPSGELGAKPPWAPFG